MQARGAAVLAVVVASALGGGDGPVAGAGGGDGAARADGPRRDALPGDAPARRDGPARDAARTDARGPADAAPSDAAPDAPLSPSPANRGWIGGACAATDECAFANAMCLREGFPNGACTMPCDGVCPDRTMPGDTTTFCIDGRPYGLDSGACVSKCDPTVLPGTGCPAGWHCAERNRFAQPSVTERVCVPPAAPSACPMADDELVEVDYPDQGLLWIPHEARCGGAFDLVVMLHGINPQSNPTPSLGGGRHLEHELRAFIDRGLLRPVLVTEPVHFQPGSTTLYGAGWDPLTHLDRLAAPLGQRGLRIASLSYTGHSGAGCDPQNGLYEVLARYHDLIPARAPSMPLWGLEDVCYAGTYHWSAPKTVLADTGTTIWNVFSVQGDPTDFEDNLLGAAAPSFPCNADIFGKCIHHPTRPWWCQRTATAVSHDTNPYFFVREVLPRGFPPN